MRSTTLVQPDECIYSQSVSAEPTARVEYDFPEPPDSLAGLDNLFCAHAVDLRCVCDAVRMRPELEALLLRLTVSLGLSPDIPIATVEAAAVVLGRDRLRVLLHTWAVLKDAHEKPHSIDRENSRVARAAGGESGSANSVTRWTPEMLYLSTFVHWFGLQGHHFPDTYESVRADFEVVNATAEELGRAQRPFSCSSLAEIAEYFSGLFERSLSSRSAVIHKKLLELAAAAGDLDDDRERTSGPGVHQAGPLSGLAEILERDFLALLPYFDLAAAKPRQKAAAAGRARSFRREAD